MEGKAKAAEEDEDEDERLQIGGYTLECMEEVDGAVPVRVASRFPAPAAPAATVEVEYDAGHAARQHAIGLASAAARSRPGISPAGASLRPVWREPDRLREMVGARTAQPDPEVAVPPCE